MKHKYPKNFARFYDTIYSKMRHGDDSQFFLDLVKKTGGRVLEVGVGTGRLFTEALDAGADIYGIDISPAMLDILYDKLDKDQHYRLKEQSITSFSFREKFDLVIAPFRVFMHLNDKEDQIKALNNVYDQLNKNGVFVFDVFNPDLGVLQNGIDQQTDFEGEYEPGRKLKRTVSSMPDLANQVINVLFRLDWEEESGPGTEEWETSLRYFFRYELEHLVERSKFESYYIAGDFEGNAIGTNSREFIVTCRKKST